MEILNRELEKDCVCAAAGHVADSCELVDMMLSSHRIKVNCSSCGCGKSSSTSASSSSSSMPRD